MPPATPAAAGPSRPKRQRSPAAESGSRTKKPRPSPIRTTQLQRSLSAAGLTFRQHVDGPPVAMPPPPEVPATPREATPASERGTPAPSSRWHTPAPGLRRSVSLSSIYSGIRDGSIVPPSPTPSRRSQTPSTIPRGQTPASVFAQLKHDRDQWRYKEMVERLMPKVSKQTSRLSANRNFQYMDISSKAFLAMPDPVDERRPLCPMTWSDNDKLFFINGERVMLRDMANDAKEVELMKMSHLRLLEAAPGESANTLAIGTVKEGQMHLMDSATTEFIRKINVKGVTYAKWNGSLLTAGSQDGSIKHIDIRVNGRRSVVAKCKGHDGYISCLSWRKDGNFLASGDAHGYLNVWDKRQLKSQVPLLFNDHSLWSNVPQEPGIITALAWVPWQSDRLVSGCANFSDKTGEISFWKIDHKLERVKPNWTQCSLVTSLHFSPSAACKEMLITSSGKFDEEWWRKEQVEPTGRDRGEPDPFDGISVLDMAFDFVTADRGVGELVTASVLSPDGTRLACAVPKYRTVKIWDVWGKARPIVEPAPPRPRLKAHDFASWGGRYQIR
ncbi:WD40 repeat-like protein [Heliocybe sulcata]|uniref:WD40 repeat-like protein n=1 Tax=Heliocybe sulcata TaxID=5364 RepID=A0A5C3MRC0_9AGAM|nr:WD40 repeat-like protein [Heliocybe sulcata]